MRSAPPSERLVRAALVLMAATALSLPSAAPAAAAGGTLLVSLCNGGFIPIPTSGKDKGKRQGKDCRIACHATDSRKRLPGLSGCFL